MCANCCWIDVTSNDTGIFSELKLSFPETESFLVMCCMHSMYFCTAFEHIDFKTILQKN